MAKQINDALNKATPTLNAIADGIWAAVGAAVIGMLALSLTLDPKALEGVAKVFLALVLGAIILLAGLILAAVIFIGRTLLESLIVVLTAIIVIFAGLLVTLLQVFLDAIAQGIATVADFILSILVSLGLISEETKNDIIKFFAGIYQWVQETLENFKIWLGNALASIPKLISDAVDEARKALTQAASDMWDSLTGGKHQVGSDFIANTGLHLLHRGEQVIPATRTGERSSSKIMNMGNITINLSGGSEYDAERIARMVAEEQRVQLRRAMSYG